MKEASEKLIPEPRLCVDPLALTERQLADMYDAMQPGWFERNAWLIVAFMFAGMLGWSAAQPVPCEVKFHNTEEPPMAFVIGQTDTASAKANREIIEQALRNGGVASLPEGLIAVDRGVRLPAGCVLHGAGRHKNILRNVSAGAPFGDNCTIQVIQQSNAGFGYSGGNVPDPITVAGSSITFQSQDAARQYAPGSYLWTYVWNGYTGSGAKTKLHKALARSNATVTVDSAPDTSATAAIWTGRAARFNALEGAQRLTIGQAVKPNQWVLLSNGPKFGNECAGEWRYIVAADANAVTLDRPLRADYGLSALAIFATPTTGATVRDLRIDPLDVNHHPVALKNCINLTLLNLDIAGDLHLFGCQYVTIADCRIAGALNLNNCRDVLAKDVLCREVFIEEMCSDLDFRRFTVVQTRPGGAGFNQPALSPCERVRLRDVMIAGAGDLPIHLRGRENEIDGLTITGSRAAATWIMSDLSGDRLRVRDLTSDLTVKVSGGSGGDIRGVLGTVYLTGGSGTVADCARVVPSTAAVAQSWGVPATQ